ncbi:p-hydroxycinnamoyl CoA hydratase/lyase [Chloroflexota bacterium]
MAQADRDAEMPVPGGKNILVKFENGIAWVILNRPEKRNAMSPALNKEMLTVLDALETDSRCKILVLTGAGEAFSAGMDLKEYFRDVDKQNPIEVMKIRREAFEWHYRRLMYFPKPTIAMVNGWCFGGAFVPLVSCDLAITADEATFGISEINWGIIPAGGVPKALTSTLNQRNGLYYAMTGETFSGKRAVEIGLVNESVPLSQLQERVVKLAEVLLQKSPTILAAAKRSYKHLQEMSWDAAFDYIAAVAVSATSQDTEKGREKGLSQFLDQKSYRPGLGVYDKNE